MASVRKLSSPALPQIPRLSGSIAMKLSLAQFSLYVLVLTTPLAASPGRRRAVPIKQNDRIGIIGNTLADRMQHDAWLEAYLQRDFPSTTSSFATLASPAMNSLRLRSANFGGPMIG
jgi:hypothetical protein